MKGRDLDAVTSMMLACRVPARVPALGQPTRVLWRGGRVVANDLAKGSLVAGSAVPGQRADRVLRVVELQHVKPGKARARHPPASMAATHL
jgi:hypothetical protein